MTTDDSQTDETASDDQTTDQPDFASAELPPDAVPERLDRELIAALTDHHVHEQVGFTPTGAITLTVEDVGQVGPLMALARDHDHTVSYDGNRTLTFMPPKSGD